MQIVKATILLFTLSWQLYYPLNLGIDLSELCNEIKYEVCLVWLDDVVAKLVGCRLMILL